MDVDNVRILLNRYYEGETSEEEERMLAEFFATAEVPADLQPDKALFTHIAACDDSSVPDGLGERLEAAIDRMDISDRMASRRRLMPRWLRMAGVAASVAIALMGGYSIMRHHEEPSAMSPKDTCSSPQEAYAYAQSALVKISRDLNRGDAGVQQAEHTVNSIMEKIDRHITIN